MNWTENGPNEKRTVLSYDTCAHLRSYLSDPGTDSLDAMCAVHTLAHEAQHMAGSRNEAETECQAQQRTVAMAELLGATHQQAVTAERRVWTETYHRMPDGYTSAECRDGGKLDENLAGAPWDVAPLALTAANTK